MTNESFGARVASSRSPGEREREKDPNAALA